MFLLLNCNLKNVKWHLNLIRIRFYVMFYFVLHDNRLCPVDYLLNIIIIVLKDAYDFEDCNFKSINGTVLQNETK